MHKRCLMSLKNAGLVRLSLFKAGISSASSYVLLHKDKGWGPTRLQWNLLAPGPVSAVLGARCLYWESVFLLGGREAAYVRNPALKKVHSHDLDDEPVNFNIIYGSS